MLDDTSYFKTILRLAKERDLFIGDLNVVQYLALNFCVNKNYSDLIELEQERMKYTILAGNATLYKSLYEEKGIEDEVSGNVEWMTPTSIEETERLVRMIEGR